MSFFWKKNFTLKLPFCVYQIHANVFLIKIRVFLYMWLVGWGISCRYGELFKTHVFGYPSIVTTSPEAAKFVLVEHPHLFRRRGLPFVEDALGYRFFGYIENHRLHMKLRKQLQVPLFHLHKLIPQLEAWAISLMRSWEGRTVNALQEAKLVLPITLILILT